MPHSASITSEQETFLLSSDRGGQVVTHEIQNGPEQGMFGVHLHKLSAAGMNSHFGRGQLEDEPSVACIH
jgi:hypothetical protein